MSPPPDTRMGWSNATRLRISHGAMTRTATTPLTRNTRRRSPAAHSRFERTRGMRTRGRKRMTSARVSDARPQARPNHTARLRLGVLPELVREQHRDRDRQHRDRLGRDQRVLDPEVRVDHRDQRGDDAGPLARDLAPDQPAHEDGRRAEQARRDHVDVEAPPAEQREQREIERIQGRVVGRRAVGNEALHAVGQEPVEAEAVDQPVGLVVVEVRVAGDELVPLPDHRVRDAPRQRERGDDQQPGQEPLRASALNLPAHPGGLFTRTLSPPASLATAAGGVKSRVAGPVLDPSVRRAGRSRP